ncbi:unnamed protein product [Musa textilis]
MKPWPGSTRSRSETSSRTTAPPASSPSTMSPAASSACSSSTCKNHANATNNGVFGGPDPVLAHRLKKWDAEFINVDNDTLFDLLEAADYLNVSSLLELTVKTIAGNMKGKTPEEIRDTFDIVCDYTPEEEQEVRRQYFWAFR